MKWHKFIAGSIAMLFALGAHAAEKNTTPAYVISETDVFNLDGMQEYRNKAPDLIKKYGGKFIAHSDQSDVKEGEVVKGRIVIIQFDNMEKAQAWYNDPEYVKIRPIRQNNSTSRVIFVEGVANNPSSK